VDPHPAIPDVRLDQVVGNALREWTWRRSLIGDFATLSGATASLPSDTHYTLDDGTWSAVAAFDRVGETIMHVDYKRGRGATIRFGDGVFGRMPAPSSRFRARYRVGNGPRFNLGADALKYSTHAAITGVTNPLPTSGGLAPETSAEARQLAPEAFRAITYRAVRPEDYAEAAERMEWVQRAGATFRWTGSWLTAFVTPDPLNAFTLSRERRNALELWLDRFRQAGRETHVSDPLYANIDLDVTARVDDSAYPGEVRAAVMLALFGKPISGRPAEFFAPDNFTFGMPLYRSALEAAIQGVAGVCAVEGLRIRRRGWTEWGDWTTLSYGVAANEIVRVQNDPRYPERGSFRLKLAGGA
jgi:predicted phage baseplate assembly protein